MAGAPTISSSEKKIVIGGDDFSLVVSKETGTMESWTFKGQELLASGPKPGLWRAPSDNDSGGKWAQKNLVLWKEATQNQSLIDMRVSDDSSSVVVSSTYELGDGVATYQVIYTIWASGDIHVQSTFEPRQDDLPVLPRLGLHMALQGRYSNLTWFGRGPHENYEDRKTGAAMSRYESTVAEQYHDYSRPQETGNKTDVRWMSLANEDGLGLLVSADETLSISALPVYVEDLDHDRSAGVAHRHGGDVEFRDLVSLHIDWKQMGVGGDNSWGARPLPKYQITPARYEYGFQLSPYDASTIDPATRSKWRYQ